MCVLGDLLSSKAERGAFCVVFVVRVHPPRSRFDSGGAKMKTTALLGGLVVGFRPHPGVAWRRQYQSGTPDIVELSLSSDVMVEASKEEAATEEETEKHASLICWWSPSLSVTSWVGVATEEAVAQEDVERCVCWMIGC